MPRFEDLAAEGQALVEVGGEVVGVDVATQAELDAVNAAKAPLASPALTGTPTVPTAPAGTNTTQAASTAFVKTATDNATSGPLAVVSWVNGGGANISTTSTTLVDVDATNAVVTFTQPASGQVLLRQTGWVEPPASDFIIWAVREGTSTVAGSEGTVAYAGGEEVAARTALITGLTPGAVVTWKWAWRTVSGGAGYMRGAGGLYQPAVMEIWSA